MTRSGIVTRTLAALTVICTVTAVAAAQDRNAVAQGPQGPMTVEQVRDGFAIAPDGKVTRLDGSSRTLVGGYGGWVFDDTLLVGAGGYWLPDGSSNRKLAYGGAVIEWRHHPAAGPIAFGIRGLAGYGQATLTSTVNLVNDGGYGPFGSFDRMMPATTTTAVVRFDQGFFVFEPQAELVVNLARRLRLTGGLGYRAIGDANGMENRLRGVSGGIALEIGGTSYHGQHPS
jgi:hypothetical protein